MHENNTQQSLSSVLYNIGGTAMNVGLLILIGVCIWWYLHFNAVVSHPLHAKSLSLLSYVPCLYAENIFGCTFAGQLPNGTPPRPPYLLFWIAVISIIGGSIIRFSTSDKNS